MSADLASADVRPSTATSGIASVAVIITTYNHARFLAKAIDSALAQTRPADEIIVVDDGSDDHPEEVTSGYPGVRLLRQPNQGLAAARNSGLRTSGSEMVVFLDADDLLLPNAIAAGLACFAAAPASGLVYGAHRRITADGKPIGEDRYAAIRVSDWAYIELLHGNMIGMHATVMYRRDRLIAAGGFDATLRRCEDYDVYLRLARLHPIVSHPEVVAEYRWHGGNASAAHREMLRWVLRVHSRQKPFAQATPEGREAWKRGRKSWRDYYAGEILSAARERRRKRDLSGAVAYVAQAAVVSPTRVLKQAARLGRRRLIRALPGRPRLELGAVRLGDFDRLNPIDDNFGFGRGTPIDRYYIENFLARHQADVHGRVLEIGDDAYTRRFGKDRVSTADVLHIHDNVPGVTIVGDLCTPEVLPADAFDCFLITQTLHLIYDVRAAATAMHRALKPGGVLLLTVPGITQIDRRDWKAGWYWSFTTASARRLFGDIFGDEAVTVESHGNVFAATTFLHGLALEEVERAKLDFTDEAYPVTITVRARKGGQR